MKVETVTDSRQLKPISRIRSERVINVPSDPETEILRKVALDMLYIGVDPEVEYEDWVLFQMRPLRTGQGYYALDLYLRNMPTERTFRIRLFSSSATLVELEWTTE